MVTPSGTTEQFHDLLTLGGSNSAATAINGAGRIVGGSQLSGDTTAHAFMFDGSLHDLGSLGGSMSQATGINNGNQIVGYSSLLGDTITHAFLYDTALHDIGVLSGLDNSVAEGINNLGQVVGYSWINNGLSKAFIYSNSTMQDLNVLVDGTGTGWNLIGATAINDRGQIAATGLRNGAYRAVLLTPRAQPISGTVRGGGG